MTRDAEHTPTGYEDAASVVVNQAPAPSSLAGGEDIDALDQELIDRGLRTVRAYDAVRFLRDALSATTARLTGYDWNADPEGLTQKQGDAFALADKVFTDLSAAVDAHPESELPECPTCGGTGKIEEAARTQGVNQHSACVRTCDDCDGCGFAPDDAEFAILDALSPEAPAREVEAAHWLTDLLGDDQNGGFIRDLCYTVWQAGRYGYNGGPGDWANDTLPTVQRGVEMVRAKVEGLLALTPRHEAPAEGAGEPFERYPALATWIARMASTGNGLSLGEWMTFVGSLNAAIITAEHSARSSAPEAREEALGNLLAVIHGDGGHRALEVGVEQAAAEAEKIVAGLFAAPSADKLREVLVEALEKISTGTYEQGRARTIARQALAALKAEGA